MYFRSYLCAPPYSFHLPVHAIVVRRSEWRNGSLTCLSRWEYATSEQADKNKKNACTGGGGDYWFDSMEEDESLPAIDAAFFDAIEAPDCMVPEPVTKKVCKSCKRNLSEAEHFMPGRKTCHEWRSNATIWEKNVGKRGGMRSWTLITTVTRSSRLLELIMRRDVVVYNKYLLFTCWAHLLTFAFDTFGSTLEFKTIHILTCGRVLIGRILIATARKNTCDVSVALVGSMKVQDTCYLRSGMRISERLSKGHGRW